MESLLSNLHSLFVFLFQELGNMAGFFVTNILGQVILGLIVFIIIVGVAVSFFSNFRR